MWTCIQLAKGGQTTARKLTQVPIKTALLGMFTGSMGGVAVIRSPLTAVVPMGRGFDPLLGYFM
jgi:hypothetical protein